MDVTEEEMTHVREGEATLGEGSLERGDSGRRAAVEERGPVVRLEQVAADDLLGAEMVKID
jgi:hypothetical protein